MVDTDSGVNTANPGTADAISFEAVEVIAVGVAVGATEGVLASILSATLCRGFLPEDKVFLGAMSNNFPCVNKNLVLNL
jgi:hypothetical protein